MKKKIIIISSIVAVIAAIGAALAIHFNKIDMEF